MAVLRRALAVMALAAPLAWSGGCSLALDADDLTAERRDATADTTPDAADTTPVADSAIADDTRVADTEAGVDVVIATSGTAGCELDYETKPLDLSECPRSCPTSGGWKLVFDATGSTGVTSYAWSFTATESYQVTPASSADGRVEVTLDVPPCDLFSGASLGSAKVYGFLTVNGDTDQEYSARIDFSVRYLSSCGSAQGTCEPPP